MVLSSSRGVGGPLFFTKTNILGKFYRDAKAPRKSRNAAVPVLLRRPAARRLAVDLSEARQDRVLIEAVGNKRIFPQKGPPRILAKSS